MEKSQSAVEVMLGHPLNNVEKMLYDKAKNNEKYEFTKDRNGNLATRKK